MSNQIEELTRGKPQSRLRIQWSWENRWCFLASLFIATIFVCFAALVFATFDIPYMQEFLTVSYYLSYLLVAVFIGLLSTAVTWISFLFLRIEKVKSLGYKIALGWLVMLFVAMCYVLIGIYTI